MKSVRILMLPLLCMISAMAFAQRGTTKLELNYAVGLPTGSLKQSVSNTSFRGGEASVMYGVSDRLSLGLLVGTQDFYQKYPRAVIHESGSDISAVITNSIQVMPIMARARMNFKGAGAVQPFVSLAAGGNLIQYQKYYGEFVDNKAKFGFAAQPALGIHIPFGKARTAGFNLSAGYNFMPFQYEDVDGLHHAVIKAGVSIPLER
jgi:hypothetical protein